MNKSVILAALIIPLSGCISGHLYGRVGDRDVNLKYEGDSEIQGIEIKPITKEVGKADMCREVNVQDEGYLRVRNLPSPSGQEVYRLLNGERINLVSVNGVNSYVEINEPVVGYTSAKYLKQC